MFRWMIGLTMVIAGGWTMLLIAAGSHGNFGFHAGNPEHWLLWGVSIGLTAGGLLVLTRGWPLRRRH